MLCWCMRVRVCVRMTLKKKHEETKRENEEKKPQQQTFVFTYEIRIVISRALSDRFDHSAHVVYGTTHSSWMVERISNESNEETKEKRWKKNRSSHLFNCSYRYRVVSFVAYARFYEVDNLLIYNNALMTIVRAPAIRFKWFLFLILVLVIVFAWMFLRLIVFFLCIHCDTVSSIHCSRQSLFRLLCHILRQHCICEPSQ